MAGELEFDEYNQDYSSYSRQVGEKPKPWMIQQLQKLGLGGDVATKVLIIVPILFFGLSILILVVHFVF